MIIPLIPTKKYIDELRDYAGLSDKQIGEAAGLSRWSIWRLRVGKHKSTELEHGIKISNLHAQIFNNKNNKKEEKANG